MLLDLHGAVPREPASCSTGGGSQALDPQKRLTLYMPNSNLEKTQNNHQAVQKTEGDSVSLT